MGSPVIAFRSLDSPCRSTADMVILLCAAGLGNWEQPQERDGEFIDMGTRLLVRARTFQLGHVQRVGLGYSASNSRFAIMVA